MTLSQKMLQQKKSEDKEAREKINEISGIESDILE